jgi:glutathione peroxidase
LVKRSSPGAIRGYPGTRFRDAGFDAEVLNLETAKTRASPWRRRSSAGSSGDSKQRFFHGFLSGIILMGMKRLLLLGALFAMGLGAAPSVDDFEMKTIDGDTVSLSQYDGKVKLFVNVASRCGYTPQYEGLQALYEKYKDDGLVILGFPANNFGQQEPGTNAEIKTFCNREYGVSFPMFSKISVKGADQHPLYKFLTSETGEQIGWNFTKILVGKNGEVIKQFESKIEPLAPELTGAIEKAF